MATTTPNQISAEFLSHFQRATTGADHVRYFQISINAQEMVTGSFASGPCGSNPSAEFDEMKSRAKDNEPCFFVFRLSQSKPKEWVFISWVPDHCAPEQKMLYSSAKANVKSKLGFNFFVATEHCTEPSELTWSSFQESQKETDNRSDFEKLHDRVLQEEKAEASERASAAGATSSASSRSAGIGGYHAVKLPLSADAKVELKKLESNQANLVELRVSDDKKEILAVKSLTVSGHQQFRDTLSTTEPRFYIYGMPRPGPGVAKDFVFVYCCPDNAPQQLRMVYSTSKGPVADSVADTVPSLKFSEKQIEVSGAEDADDATLREATAARGGVNVIKPAAGYGGYGGARGSAPDNGGTVKTSQNVNRVGGGNSTEAGQHPIYGLLGGNGSTSTGKKKIVIPPKHAW